MKCESLALELSAYADGEIKGTLKGEVEEHVRKCGGCRKYLASLLALQDRLDETLKAPVETVDMIESVMSFLPRSAGKPLMKRTWMLAAAAALIIAFICIFAGRHAIHQAPTETNANLPVEKSTNIEPTITEKPERPAGRPTASVPAADKPEKTAPQPVETGIEITQAADALAEITDVENDDTPVISFTPLPPPKVGCSPMEGMLDTEGGNREAADRYLTAMASSPPKGKGPARGIAILSSSIGNTVSPEVLARFVEQNGFSPVVIDWAWITHHWDRTDFAAVNKFLALMAADGIPTAAMYRPRFTSNPTVPTQMDKNGRRGTDHAGICYSDPSARLWGISWGERILEKCPDFREIIIYNPLNYCCCQECRASLSRGRNSAVRDFLTEAKTAWQARQPDVKLGVVYITDAGFWNDCSGVIDIAHPFLCIRADTDTAREIANIKTVRSIAGNKMGPCLAKITWEDDYKVPPDKIRETDRAAAEAGLPYFFWTFETLFMSNLYDPSAVMRALDRSDLIAAAPPCTGWSGAETGSADKTTLNEAQALLAKLAGQKHCDLSAMDPLIEKAKNCDAATRLCIINSVEDVVNDKSRADYPRWICLKVLSGIGDDRAVPFIIDVLLNNKTEIIRYVAAGELGIFYKQNPTQTIKDSLITAANKETSERTLQTISELLGDDMPAVAPKPSPSPNYSTRSVNVSAAAVEDLSPSGPPQPPDGPPVPVEEPLPWPFPGGQEKQVVFNNYQQPTDMYIHCALDFIQPAGTPVTAVESGYVAAVYTNYPQWITHHFFIVTPEKGGDTGWCYTHLDPRTFTFKVGDYVQQGQTLGKLVDFSVGSSPGVAHLHLHCVRYNVAGNGKVETHSLIDPLYYFDWKDTVPPSFQPLRFVVEGTTAQFEEDSGITTVKGRVDILAAITDSAYNGHAGNLGVPVVMLSISDGSHTMQKLVLDHRGDVGSEKQTKPLYMSYEEKKAFFNPDSFPRYQMLRVTKTDGDGLITPRDRNECWDTTAKDRNGNPLWPDGEYSVNVYAWDIAGNRSAVGAKVRVKNH